MAVDPDVFPVTLGDLVCLVKDAEMRVLLGVLVPPVPAPAVVLRVSKLVEAFYVFQVDDLHKLVRARTFPVADPG